MKFFLQKRTIANNQNIANEEGMYKNFTGIIEWKEINGKVINATFKLVTGMNYDIIWERVEMELDGCVILPKKFHDWLHHQIDNGAGQTILQNKLNYTIQMNFMSRSKQCSSFIIYAYFI